MESVLIKAAKLVDYNKNFIGDILIENGKIKHIDNNIEHNCHTINANGLCLMPAFVDMHAHFREPGYTYKEDIQSGSKAALKGGYSFINLMPNTNPVCSFMSTVNEIRKKSKALNLIDIHQCLSITKNMDGKTLDHLSFADFDVKYISDDGKGVDDALTMYNAMLLAKKLNIGILSHSEAMDITIRDSRLSENLETVRNLCLAQSTGVNLHLTHVSTVEAINAISFYKSQGLSNISCDVTPHHISLWNNDYRVNPPIRSKNDVDSIINAIQNGIVDAIGTDHAPHSLEDKQGGSPGISGLETAFSLCYESLVLNNGLDIRLLSKIMSYNPAKLMDINKGCLEPGYDGDLVLIDLNKSYVLNSDNFVSKGKNTPFNSRTMYGEIITTIKSGRILYDNR